MADLLPDQHLVHHGHEDGVLLAELVNQGRQGVHGGLPKLRGGVEATDQGVDDSGRELREVELIGQAVDALERLPPDLQWHILGVEQPHDGRQDQVKIIRQGASKLLKGGEQFSRHMALSTENKYFLKNRKSNK